MAHAHNYPEVPVRLPIKLGQFVKLANLAESGAHATELIASGEVTVNGAVNTQRGAKLAAGDEVVVAEPEPGMGDLGAVVVAENSL